MSFVPTAPSIDPAPVQPLISNVSPPDVELDRWAVTIPASDMLGPSLAVSAALVSMNAAGEADFCATTTPLPAVAVSVPLPDQPLTMKRAPAAPIVMLAVSIPA